MERPALQRLLAAIARGEVDVVVVYKIDRLTRALADFARMVEIFDRHQVSFVSVTQAFNTTSSMGRLTLNVLLSFAQFEREVTGERIRDKIAASKEKGMWMGGTLPLGYDMPQPGSRALVVNEREAELVRHLFRRYLALGSVHALERELASEGLRSKAWVTRAGRPMGGLPFSRGALFHLLRSRTYLGEIVHRGTSHPGLHPALVDEETFAAVQARLAESRRRGAEAAPMAAPTSEGVEGQRPGADEKSPGADDPDGAAAAEGQKTARTGLRPGAAPAPLTGRLLDADGHPMSPSFTRGRTGKLYRYYVSAPLQQGKACPANASAIRRVSAPALEQVVGEALRRLLPAAPADPADPLALVHRLELRRGELRLWLLRGEGVVGPEGEDGVPVEIRDGLAECEAAVPDPRDPALVRVVLPFVHVPRGGDARVLKGTTRSAAPDPVLVRALREAHTMVARDSAGLPRIESSPTSPHRRRLVRLAFLAPDLQRAILAGTQPPGLTLARLLEQEMPLDWTAQRQMLGVG